MLPLEARKYLYDIREACELIMEFAEGKTLEDYTSDPMLRSAVERQFEVIGEALSQLAKVDHETAALISEHTRIICTHCPPRTAVCAVPSGCTGYG